MKKLMILAALAGGLALFGGENTAKAEHRGCSSGFSSGGFSFGNVYAPQTSYYRPSYYGGGSYGGYGSGYGGSYIGYSRRSGFGYYRPGFSISFGSGRRSFGSYGHRHSHRYGW